MNTLFSLIWIVTFIAFIVFWRKKKAARKAAGENYQDNPIYKQISKQKRIIGIVCIVSLLLAGATSSDSDKSSNAPSKNGVSTTNKQADRKEKQQEYITVDVSSMMSELENNAASASKKYKGKYVKVTNGVVTNIDADGKYFDVGSGEKFALKGIQCYTQNQKQKDQLSELQKKGPVIVYGRISDVGEIMGYSLKIDKFEAK